MVYDELNKAWKSTCRVLFRREIGESSDFNGLKQFRARFPGAAQILISKKAEKGTIPYYLLEKFSTA